jgi:hypothetical protein
MDRTIGVMQKYMEQYMTRVFQIVEPFSSWNRQKAYEGVLSEIPLFNSVVQLEDYQVARREFPDLQAVIVKALYDEGLQGTQDELVFFLHSFISTVSTKLLLYRSNLPIIQCVDETNRTALARFAFLMALESTVSHFPPNNHSMPLYSPPIPKPLTPLENGGITNVPNLPQDPFELSVPTSVPTSGQTSGTASGTTSGTTSGQTKGTTNMPDLPQNSFQPHEYNAENMDDFDSISVRAQKLSNKDLSRVQNQLAGVSTGFDAESSASNISFL